MSMGSKIYGAYMSQNRIAGRSRGTAAKKRRGEAALICPFTLEAVRDCAVRKRAPRTACSFSLEDCLAPR